MVVNTQNIIEIDEVIEASQSVLTSLFSEQGSETEEIRTVAGRVIETIDEQYHRAGDDLVGITSGFAEMDKNDYGFFSQVCTSLQVARRWEKQLSG